MASTKKVTSEYRKKHWMEIIKDRQESGLTTKAYCKNAGINESSYFYWQNKLREEACKSLSRNESIIAQAEVVKPTFAEVRIAENPVMQTLVEDIHISKIHIEVAGIRIEADDAYPTNKLAALLRELVQPC